MKISLLAYVASTETPSWISYEKPFLEQSQTYYIQLNARSGGVFTDCRIHHRALTATISSLYITVNETKCFQCLRQASGDMALFVSS